MTKRLRHDQFFKKIMSNEIAAQEFLEYYLPNDFKEKIDLSKIKIEKESYIEESLRRRFSDIVYSVRCKNDEAAFIYVLLEHQSTADYWMALRLWKYALLLCERHKKNEDKLPLICPIIMYNGVEKYNAPRNLWNLFTDSEQAKKLMTEDYQLVDLQGMSDDEIVQKKHLGMMEYVMKHIHQRDMIKLWEKFLRRFELEILVDKENGYIYLRSFLWYTDAKLPEERQSELEQLLTKYLSEEEKENIMRTVAQKYIEEGEIRAEAKVRTIAQKYIEEGEIRAEAKVRTIAQKYIDEGEARGEEKKAMAVAKNLLKVGVSIDIISKSTGLSKKAIEELMV